MAQSVDEVNNAKLTRVAASDPPRLHAPLDVQGELPAQEKRLARLKRQGMPTWRPYSAGARGDGLSQSSRVSSTLISHSRVAISRLCVMGSVRAGLTSLPGGCRE